ncbi:hypothetical protein O6H91_23G068300 [Diphasiastrum complanatum]|nr:hypothetical protein O6H91_23G068300 [Diphasiastrum complanatum]
MGCGSSKYMRIQYEFEQGRNASTPFFSTISLRIYHRHPKLKCSQHLVALTSTTYGAWNLLEAIEHSTEKPRDIPEDKATSHASTENVSQHESFGDLNLNLDDSLAPLQIPEVIDASELMAGLEEELMDEEDTPGAQSPAKLVARSPLRVAAIEGSTRRTFYAKSFSISSLHDLHQLHAFLRGSDRPHDDALLREHYPCVDVDRKRLLSKGCDKENAKPVLDLSPHRRSSLDFTELNVRQGKRTPLKAPNRIINRARGANALIEEAARASVPHPGGKCDGSREESQYQPLKSDRACSPIASLLASPSRKLSARKTSRRSSSAVSARWNNINAISCIEPTTPYGSFHRISLSHQSDNLTSPIFDPDLLASFETAIQLLGIEQDRFSSRLLQHATASPYGRGKSIEAISPSKANNIRTPLKPIQIRNSTLRTPLRSRVDRNICSTASHSVTATADLKRNVKMSIIKSESSDIKLFTSSESAHLMKGSGRLVDIRDASVESGNISNPLDYLRQLCPPGGEQSVVLYTTSLRGIRKTFEDCCSMQAMLQSLGIHVDERDVSMHAGFLQELKELLGPDSACVPRLFIRGYYVGGKDEALKLHEEDVIARLVVGMRRQEDGGWKCDGCGGMRFLPCLDCSGSCKIVRDGGEVLRCSDCNENGLIRCPICC